MPICCGLSDFGSLHMAVLFVSPSHITKARSLNHHNRQISNMVNPHWLTCKLQASNIWFLSAWLLNYFAIKERDIQTSQNCLPLCFCGAHLACKVGLATSPLSKTQNTGQILVRMKRNGKESGWKKKFSHV